ncbi:MAG TPA: baseplate J/gp47 family protein [Polyangiaceae bacterium]|jgi:hypothetical protein|nr:baseplate J/gp47 family protein [Polyangiaceae bacterium]
MTTPSEPAFVTFARGVLRDEMLANFRNGLRRLVNPDTKDFFTEEEIRQATQDGSRDYLRFDALDLGLQSGQQRARFTAQQTNPSSATSTWLRGFHCAEWDVTPLPASSGAGQVSWPATTGSIFVGSTLLGDPAVFTATDPQGNTYQASSTVRAVSGIATLTMVAVKGGKGTNPESGTTLSKGANVPLGAGPTGTTSTDFAGGFDAENDADVLDRLLDRIRRKPASGNRAQFRAWARGVSTAIRTAFVYPCLFNAGSVCVVIVGKRSTQGPTARVDSANAVLTLARNYLTPPSSPVVPARPYVLLHAAVSDPISMSMALKMRTKTTGGWADATPWPSPIGTDTSVDAFCRVTSLPDATHFHVNSAVVPSTGVGPAMMVWNATTSRFEKLPLVASVTLVSGTEYVVQLSDNAPATLTVNSVVCPYTPLLESIAEAAESYFDSLGPGEMIDLATSPRAGRAYRWPEPADEFPYEAGESIGTSLFDALGRALSGVSLRFVSHTTPTLPPDISQEGPRLLTLNDFGVYAQ